MALVVKATEQQAHRLMAVAEAEGTAGTRAATAIGQQSSCWEPPGCRFSHWCEGIGAETLRLVAFRAGGPSTDSTQDL
jgi:hypothetical protein